MNRDDFQLVFRDVPVFLWIFGLIFGGLGAYLWYMEDLQVPPYFFIPFLVVGLLFLLFTSALTITADRTTRTLKLEYRSLVRYRLTQVAFDEIDGIGIQVSSTRNRTSYRLVLQRKDGKVIPFRKGFAPGGGKKARRASMLREFIGVPIFDDSPAGQAFAALRPIIGKMQETHGIRWEIQQASPDSPRTRWHSPDFKTQGFFLFVAQKGKGQSSQGFLASIGSMLIKTMLANYLFKADDTPGLDQIAVMAPLDPAIEPTYMAYTNSPAPARPMLNSGVAALLADWAVRFPLETMHKLSSYGQLMVLFSPNGVYLVTMNPIQPEQVNELTTLGTELIKSQSGSRAQFSSTY